MQTLQNEWDALVLETFTMKQQYNSIRQELSYALYAQDAATRVVARVIKERDAAREFVIPPVCLSFVLTVFAELSLMFKLLWESPLPTPVARMLI